MKGRQPTAKQRRFITALLRDPDGGHVEAAKAAGYAKPGEVGLRLVRRLGPWIEEARAKASYIGAMGPEEIIKGLEQIAQDVEHRDRFNALKMLASLHKLDDTSDASEATKAEISDTLQVLRETSRARLPASMMPAVPDSKRRLKRA